MTNNPSLLHAACGLTEEAGEFMGHIKKHVFLGHPLNQEAAIKELGDIRFYMELAAHLLGVSMEEVERRNVEKLRDRYPEGFSTEASVNRKEDSNGA
jgi:NTP pyrophosphatase (non-canonical NTP hydrolase)